MGEGALYEVSFKDLRPSLEWSPDFGWTVPTSQVLPFALFHMFFFNYVSFSLQNNIIYGIHNL